jgi:hypothetical protein
MNFFKRLFGSSRQQDERGYWIYVKCNRCGEKIEARIDLANDLSIEYGENEAVTTYFCRKVLMGEQRCYQQIEVELTFDSAHRLKDRQIRGGQFISEADFQSA